jgi:dihydroflavonol-4-reductase
MLILVTGGTGFVGCHTIAAVTKAGHTVRVLARDAPAVEKALAPLDVPDGAVEVRMGDVTDSVTVHQAMRGVDAVVHAAAVYSFDSRHYARIQRTNVAGTQNVLAAAWQAGVSRSVYVSTFGALEPDRDGAVGPLSPPGRAREPYLASKAGAEGIARWYQAKGAPVAITYPPALLGPGDPKLGDQTVRLRNTLRGLMPAWPSGGFPVGDVRDTAELHRSLLESPSTVDGRFFGPGRYLSTRDYVGIIREVTGRALPTAFMPARAMLPFAFLASQFQRIWPWHIPAEFGACYVCALDARPAAGLGTLVPARPVSATIAETIAWLATTGRLTARQAGLAATRSAEFAVTGAETLSAEGR